MKLYKERMGGGEGEARWGWGEGGDWEIVGILAEL
jgi:hypothetical protein